jgi:hypothetical protein
MDHIDELLLLVCFVCIEWIIFRNIVLSRDDMIIVLIFTHQSIRLLRFKKCAKFLKQNNGVLDFKELLIN